MEGWIQSLQRANGQNQTLEVVEEAVHHNNLIYPSVRPSIHPSTAFPELVEESSKRRSGQYYRPSIKLGPRQCEAALY